MAHSNSVLRPRSEFDNFLFAPIGEDRNGTPISVLSALARLNVDPWQEAGELSQLPREAAGRKLASIIAALTGAPSVQLQSASIAARLIALLPAPAAQSQVQPETPPPPSPANKAVRDRFMITWVVMMAVVFAAQAVMSGGQQPASPQVKGPAAATALAAPQTSAAAAATAIPAFKR